MAQSRLSQAASKEHSHRGAANCGVLDPEGVMTVSKPGEERRCQSPREQRSHGHGVLKWPGVMCQRPMYQEEKGIYVRNQRGELQPKQGEGSFHVGGGGSSRKRRPVTYGRIHL